MHTIFNCNHAASQYKQRMAIRLYINSPLSTDQIVEIDKSQSHYLANVMRKKAGDTLLVFNGTDGEWQCSINTIDKKSCSLHVQQQTKPQTTEPDIWLCFAPIKLGKIDFLAQKATELGAAKLIPTITQHTIVNRVKIDRLKSNAIEAAEQCERLCVPSVDEPIPFEKLLASWDANRHIFFADETGSGKPAHKIIAESNHSSAAIIIGPEGGFSAKELEQLRQADFATPISLGPRVLRADTAALAALTAWQLHAGDWHKQPRFDTKED